MAREHLPVAAHRHEDTGYEHALLLASHLVLSQRLVRNRATATVSQNG